jgi:hypothetical protein
VARKRNTLGVKAQLDREIKQLDVERERLVTARAALDGKTVAPRAKRQRFSQDDVAAYLGEHPASTYIEIAEGLGALATNIAAHLNRGQKAGRFTNVAGKWSLG